MIDFQEKFSNALPYEAFLDQHGSEIDKVKWQSVLHRVELSVQQVGLLHGFSRELNILVLAGAWCGDCVRQCPILQKFALEQPKIQLRFTDRDADEELKSELVIIGASRVPQVVFLSEDFLHVGRFGDRTISYYRDLEQKSSGASCATGLVGDKDPLFDAVVSDWLLEIERIQLMLRLSPSLRAKHND